MRLQSRQKWVLFTSKKRASLALAMRLVRNAKKRQGMGRVAVGDRVVVSVHGEVFGTANVLLESGDIMPILVKHSGNIAPELVGAYGGGMGKRYAEQSDDAMRRIEARRAAAARASGGGMRRIGTAGGKSERQQNMEDVGVAAVGDNAARLGGGQAPDQMSDQQIIGGSRTWRQPAKQTPEDLRFARQQQAADAQAGRQLAIQNDAQANADAQWRAKEDARLREINPLYGVDMKGWGEEKKKKFRDLQTTDEKSRKDLTPEEIPEYNRQLQNKVASIAAMQDEAPETIPLGDQQLSEGQTVEFGGNLLQAIRGSTGKLEFKQIAKKDVPKESPEEKRKAMAEQKKEDRRSKLVAVVYKEMSVDSEGNAVTPDDDAVLEAVKKREAIMDKLSEPDPAMHENVETIDDAGNVVDPTKLPAGSYVSFQRDDGTVGRAQTMKDGRLRELAPGEKEKAQAAPAPDAKASATQGQSDPLPSDMPKDWGVARITTDAQFEALPSGTEFIGPDGIKRRKP